MKVGVYWDRIRNCVIRIRVSTRTLLGNIANQIVLESKRRSNVNFVSKRMLAL